MNIELTPEEIVNLRRLAREITPNARDAIAFPAPVCEAVKTIVAQLPAPDRCGELHNLGQCDLDEGHMAAHSHSSGGHTVCWWYG